MSSNIKVSVIVPVYNVENYLEQCLNSLINQTLKDIEIICVNDGSTDNSLDILEKFASNDKRIKIITQENKGLSGARNTGMKYVTGKYISFIDSDDWIELNALEKLFIYSEELNLDITMFPFRNYYDSDGSFEQNDSISLNMFDSRFDNLSFNYKDVLDILFEIPHCTWNKLYSTKFLKNIDVTFIEGKYYEDVDFYFKTFLKAHNIGLIRDILLNYRIRDKSISTNGDIKSFDIFEILDHSLRIIKDEGIYNQVKQDFFKYLIVNFKFVYNRLDKKYSEEFFNVLTEKYEYFNLNQVDNSINTWHFDDRVFYQAITKSKNASEFDLTYQMLYYKFLANHYEGVIKQLTNQCNDLNQQLNNKNNTSVKSKIKGIIRK